MKAQELLNAFDKGLLIDVELESRLAALPWEELVELEDAGLLKRAGKLKVEIAKGNTFVITGGITQEEVRRRAAEGSVAAQAIQACHGPAECLFCGCRERLESGGCPECGAPDQAEALKANKHWDWKASKAAGKPVRRAPAWLVEAMEESVTKGPGPDPGGE